MLPNKKGYSKVNHSARQRNEEEEFSLHWGPQVTFAVHLNDSKNFGMFVFILWGYKDVFSNWDWFIRVPDGGNGALRWCAPAWSEPTPAAHLSNYRPLLEKEQKESCWDRCINTTGYYLKCHVLFLTKIENSTLKETRNVAQYKICIFINMTIY